MKRLGGGCQLPVAVFGQKAGKIIRMAALVGALDGKTIIRQEISGPAADAADLGDTLAREILSGVVGKFWRRSTPRDNNLNAVCRLQCLNHIKRRTIVKKGKVYLIGAGPGDPGLITLKGIQCLKKADVVIYDHLVSEEIPPTRKPRSG